MLRLATTRSDSLRLDTTHSNSLQLATTRSDSRPHLLQVVLHDGQQTRAAAEGACRVDPVPQVSVRRLLRDAVRRQLGDLRLRQVRVHSRQVLHTHRPSAQLRPRLADSTQVLHTHRPSAQLRPRLADSTQVQHTHRPSAQPIPRLADSCQVLHTHRPSAQLRPVYQTQPRSCTHTARLLNSAPSTRLDPGPAHTPPVCLTPPRLPDSTQVQHTHRPSAKPLPRLADSCQVLHTHRPSAQLRPVYHSTQVLHTHRPSAQLRPVYQTQPRSCTHTPPCLLNCVPPTQLRPVYQIQPACSGPNVIVCDSGQPNQPKPYNDLLRSCFTIAGCVSSIL